MNKAGTNKIEQWRASLTPRQRIGMLVLIALVLFALLSITVFRDEAVSLFRRVTFSQGQDDFPHNAQSNSLFLGLDDELLIATKTQVQLVSPTGAAHVKQAVDMTTPALNASGPYAVVYDVGGLDLCVLTKGTLVHQMTLPEEESLISATVNEKGWLAVTSKVSGYKAVVTVYNPALEAVMAIRLSSRYVSDAVVTPDCRGVYLISPGQAGGMFENTLLYYTFSTREAPTREVSLGSNVVLSILCTNRCWILGDESLLLLDSSGVITATYDYGGQYLKMGTLQGDDFAVLFLSRSASGSSGTLITVDDDGDELGRFDIEGQPMALASQGNRVAVLTTSDVITSNRKLDKIVSAPNQRGVRNLAIYEDGSVALIGSATVSLYFPSGSGEKNEPDRNDDWQPVEDTTDQTEAQPETPTTPTETPETATQPEAQPEAQSQ